jgi:transposase-like protein
MTSKTRRNHGSAFKAKVALEAIREESTVPEIAAKYGLHPTLVNQWKRTAIEGMAAVFEKGPSKSEKGDEAATGELYKQIGQMKVEIDFLSRKLGR